MTNFDGGLSVPEGMRKLIAKPGYLSFARGGQELRDFYGDGACFDWAY